MKWPELKLLCSESEGPFLFLTDSWLLIGKVLELILDHSRNFLDSIWWSFFCKPILLCNSNLVVDSDLNLASDKKVKSLCNRDRRAGMGLGQCVFHSRGGEPPPCGNRNSHPMKCRMPGACRADGMKWLQKEVPRDLGLGMQFRKECKEVCISDIWAFWEEERT